MDQELIDQFAIARTAIDYLEDRLQSGLEPPEQIRSTLTIIVAAFRNHGVPQRMSKKPQRGVGYDWDEAQIVESIPEHGSLPKAVEAHYVGFGPEWHEAVCRRIRRRSEEIGHLIGE